MRDAILICCLCLLLMPMTRGNVSESSDLQNVHSYELPIELIDFNVASDGDDIRLTWSSASELNNKGFEILRSRNPNSGFEVIDFIDGLGSSSENHTYEYVDMDLETGIEFHYRLKQVDFDATYTYTAIKSIKVPVSKAASFGVFPNPANELIQITLENGGGKGGARMALMDGTGKSVLRKKFNPEEKSVISLDVSQLDNGIYFLRIELGQEVHVEEIMILR